jgi:putative hydrolase of the HAD superfamily
VTRAVVFDLFETLVDYDERVSRVFSAAAADLLGRDPEEFHTVWRAGRPARDSGPLRDYLASIEIGGGEADRLVELRRASSLALLAEPRPGVLDTIAELRGRGLGVGLITVCSEDVVDVWEETPFAGVFDSVVFSCACGLRKPDPGIYRIALEQLGVEPSEALFVGDGANDELAGAERIGMRAVLVHRPGEEPAWPEVRDWPGARITSIRDLLSLV